MRVSVYAGFCTSDGLCMCVYIRVSTRVTNTFPVSQLLHGTTYAVNSSSEVQSVVMVTACLPW